MRIIMVCAVFPPEPVVSSYLCSNLAQYLADRGHSLTVITAFPNRPGGRLFQGYKRALIKREIIEGRYRLIRCFSWISPRSTILSRFLEYATFGLLSAWIVLTSSRPEVIFANTWPLFASGPLSLVSWIRRLGLVLNVQDLYPESLVAQGRLAAGGTPARWLARLDRAIVEASAAVIVPAPSFARILTRGRGVGPDKLHVIPNWLSPERISVRDDRAPEFRRGLGIPDGSVVFLYGGNVGAAAGVETVVDGFRNLIDLERVYLVVAGDGSRLGLCRKRATETRNPRIRFHSPWPAAETGLVLGAADVLVLPTRGAQSLASIPSKMVAYMLAGWPILTLARPESDLAELVRESGCGWLCEPDDPVSIGETIREIARASPEKIRAFGLAGRVFALARFTPEVILPRFGSVVESVGRGAARAGGGFAKGLAAVSEEPPK